jgi:hypothetical protein
MRASVVFLFFIAHASLTRGHALGRSQPEAAI